MPLAATTAIVCRGFAKEEEEEEEEEEDSTPHLQHIAHPGACGKTRVMPQNRWLKLELSEFGGCQVDIETMSDHAVVVAGGGPTGLMLAGELALAGVDVAIAERRASQNLIGSRAGGLHSRTIEVLDQRGIADRFLSQGKVAQVAGFSQIRLDISDFPTRHPYGLALWQNHIERILAGWVDELTVPIYRECEVTRVAQDCTGVDVKLSDRRSLRAEYLVGCDGGRSAVRKSADIEFPGWDPTMSYLLAEVEMTFEPGREPQWGIRHDAFGVHALSMLDDGGPVRVMVTEQHLGPNSEPTLDDLSEALVAVYETDYGIHSPTWISRSTDMARQAAAYRDGRVLLAGDAAHVHHPVGGQGLNTGVQDAVNLGWKLAQVVKGTSPESLLDTYHAERHPVGARVLRNALAAVTLRCSNDRITALRDTLSELLKMDVPRKHFAAMLSGLDIRYDHPNSHAPTDNRHPLLGRRMPDLDLTTAKGPLRLFTLLHKAQPVLLNIGAPGRFDITPWANRVQLVDAEWVDAEDVGTWELPALGAVPTPTAVLIRPDGHVAWVGDQPQNRSAGLRDALETWFGPPNGSSPAR
jgi:2-polyprenyl-6-methoxyphenol hydroxylase-like FAD-dependent oxidoreductase